MLRFFKQLARFFVVIFVLAPVLDGCTRREEKEVNLERHAAFQPLTSAQRPGLRIGMGAMVTPKEGFIYYSRLKHYLEETLRIQIQLVDRDSYQELNKLLQKGEVDAAFVSSGPYVDGHDTFGLELVAVPEVEGKRTYQSYIIVPADSAVKGMSDLRGKSFAFTDPLSHSGWLVPVHMLLQNGERPTSYFSKTTYTYAHDKSIKAVAANLVDGAAVDCYIYDYMARNNSFITAKTRVIARSTPCGSPPFVAGPKLDPQIKSRLQAALLAMHEVPEGKKILAGMMIDRFVIGYDREYDTIREMRRAVGREGRGL